MFSILPKANLNFWATIMLTSANALNLDQSNILYFGKGLTHYHMTKFLDWSKMKQIADDILKCI